MLDAFREAAIASILHRINSAKMPPEVSETVGLHGIQAAAEWKEHPDVAAEIEAYLARDGFEEIAVNVDVFIQAQREFAMFDSLIHAVQHWRMALFREIAIRPEVISRTRRTVFGGSLQSKRDRRWGGILRI